MTETLKRSPGMAQSPQLSPSSPELLGKTPTRGSFSALHGVLNICIYISFSMLHFRGSKRVLPPATLEQVRASHTFICSLSEVRWMELNWRPASET